MTRRRLGVVLLAAYAVLQVLGRRAGATDREREARLRGDELIHRPQLLTNHAISIAAPPEAVWPWLTQVGWHRAGWYTPRWVDALLFPANWPSLRHLDPDLVRDLQVGDRIPDGPPGTAEFVVAHVVPAELLVLRSTTHLPPGWADHGAALDWTWTFRLSPREGGNRTRLQLRVRGRMSPWWLVALYEAAIVPADAIMGPGMLRGIRRRVEAARPRPGSAPAAAG